MPIGLVEIVSIIAVVFVVIYIVRELITWWEETKKARILSTKK
jgi:hypothetical protein